MAYASVAEIEADFKDLTFTTTSNVKIVDVEQFVVEADALINSYVGTVYAVPVATGDGLNLLKLLSRSLVAGRVKTLMEVKQEKSTDANQNVRGVLLSVSQVMALLKNIQDQKISLEGATPLSSSGAFYSKNADDDVEPVMLKDTRQW